MRVLVTTLVGTALFSAQTAEERLKTVPQAYKQLEACHVRSGEDSERRIEQALAKLLP